MADLVADAWWVAGSPCSGKTTLARRLAADLGAHLYSCDDAFDRHAAAVTPAIGPTLKKVTSWSAAQRLAQPVEVQLHDVMALCQEQWPLIQADLRSDPGPVIDLALNGPLGSRRHREPELVWPLIGRLFDAGDAMPWESDDGNSSPDEEPPHPPS